jgi:hypothetical protein
VFKFQQGDRRIQREVRTGSLIYREVFQQGRLYQRGDSFTYGGSIWVTMSDAVGHERPTDDSGVYRLAVKKGTDAKVRS